MHPICRRGPRLTLRELTVDDVDAVHAIYGSPEATAHLVVRAPLARPGGRYRHALHRISRCKAS